MPLALAKQMVKQGEVIFFPSGKKIWIKVIYWQIVGEYKDNIINLNQGGM